MKLRVPLVTLNKLSGCQLVSRTSKSAGARGDVLNFSGCQAPVLTQALGRMGLVLTNFWLRYRDFLKTPFRLETRQPERLRTGLLTIFKRIVDLIFIRGRGRLDSPS